MQYIALPGAMAPVLGPSVGGFIVTYFSWPWIFFINVPIGIAGVLLIRRFVPDLPREQVAPLDIVGFLLAAFGLASLVFGFESLGRGIVPFWLEVVLLVVGACCGVLYLGHARRSPNPIIDLKLMEKQTFAASITGGALFYITTSAAVFLLAVLFQTGFGLSAVNAGLILLGVAAGSLAARFVLRPLLKWFGFRNLLIGVPIIWGLYLVVCGVFSAATPLMIVLPALFVGGLARSLMYGSLQSLSYAEMPRSLMSRATAFFALSQQFAQSLGVGLTALIVHFGIVVHSHSGVEVSDLRWGFLLIALSSFLSVFVFFRLPAAVGASLEGRTAREQD
jgi:MFS family permease